MVLLVHATSIYALKDILKDGALRPSCETGNARNAPSLDDDSCLDEVYLSVYHPFQKFEDLNEIAFFFKPDVLKKYKTSHWSPKWWYGEFVDDKSIKYDKTKTPEQNIQLWGEAYKRLRTKRGDKNFIPGLQTDEVVMKKAIPLEGNLVAIYVPRYYSDEIREQKILIPDHIRIKTRVELKKFLKEHGYA
jgi:hypothetical protein